MLGALSFLTMAVLFTSPQGLPYQWTEALLDQNMTGPGCYQVAAAVAGFVLCSLIAKPQANMDHLDWGFTFGMLSFTLLKHISLKQLNSLCFITAAAMRWVWRAFFGQRNSARATGTRRAPPSSRRRCWSEPVSWRTLIEQRNKMTDDSDSRPFSPM